MATLEDAQRQVQRLHGIVEHMAMAIRSEKDASGFGLQLRRAGTPLVGLLKPQFGFVADQVSQLLLLATRGGAAKVKLRTLREGVAHVRAQLDIAITKVKEQHALHKDDGESASTSTE